VTKNCVRQRLYVTEIRKCTASTGYKRLNTELMALVITFLGPSEFDELYRPDEFPLIQSQNQDLCHFHGAHNFCTLRQIQCTQNMYLINKRFIRIA
jgi:hypothetical protein